MKSIIYFHGLESKQGGPKIDYLAKSFFIHAPQMTYAQPQTWKESIKTVENAKFDIIIGSSMGGLMGFFTGYKLPCKMLLFNPAFERIPTYISNWQCNSQEQRATIDIVLGRHDTEVIPEGTLAYLKDNGIKAEVKFVEMEHRVSIQTFESEVQQFKAKYSL